MLTWLFLAMIEDKGSPSIHEFLQYNGVVYARSYCGARTIAISSDLSLMHEMIIESKVFELD
eukprot:500273-Hanusia_phi.AAC.1